MKITFILLFLMSYSVWAFESISQKDIVSGQSVELNANTLKANKATVLLFLSARCPCSNSHVSEIKDLNTLFKDQIRFIGIHSNQNENALESKKYFTQIELGFPVLEDSDAIIADRYKAFKTPHVFVLDSRGEVIYRGGVSSSQHFDSHVKKYLRDVLTDINQGQAPRMSESKSLGCVILRTQESL